jgi:uncharacterized membrane protein
MLSAFVDYAGRLHPLVIHFPIALLVVGAVGEAVRIWRDSPSLGRFVTWVVVIGAFSAFLAAATGWLFAYQVHRPPELRPILFWHRWLGVAAIGMSLLAAWAADRWASTPQPRQRRLRRALIWMTALLIAGTAHLGAALVWGTDFFS